MFNMEVSVLAHNWPRLMIIVKLPDGRILEETCYYDIAMSQFEVKIRNGLQLMMNDILRQMNPKHKA